MRLERIVSALPQRGPNISNREREGEREGERRGTSGWDEMTTAGRRRWEKMSQRQLLSAVIEMTNLRRTLSWAFRSLTR